MKISTSYLETSVSAIRAAMAEHAKRYPQYRGRFDNYVPVLVLAKVETKMGVAFEQNEIALAAPLGRPIFPDYYRTVFSLRNMIDTRILKGNVREIRAEGGAL